MQALVVVAKNAPGTAANLLNPPLCEEHWIEIDGACFRFVAEPMTADAAEVRRALPSHRCRPTKCGQPPPPLCSPELPYTRPNVLWCGRLTARSLTATLTSRPSRQSGKIGLSIAFLQSTSGAMRGLGSTGTTVLTTTTTLALPVRMPGSGDRQERWPGHQVCPYCPLTLFLPSLSIAVWSVGCWL